MEFWPKAASFAVGLYEWHAIGNQVWTRMVRIPSSLRRRWDFLWETWENQSQRFIF